MIAFFNKNNTFMYIFLKIVGKDFYQTSTL
jgi:hypothetical protein